VQEERVKKRDKKQKKKGKGKGEDRYAQEKRNARRVQ
jgi:hypothetical protein